MQCNNVSLFHDFESSSARWQRQHDEMIQVMMMKDGEMTAAIMYVCTSKRGLSFQWGDKMLNSSVVNEILINFIKFYIRESFQFHRSSHVISNRFASPRDWDVNFAAVLRESLFRLVMWNYCFSLSRYPLLLLGWWDDCDSSRGKGQNLKLTSMKCKSLSTSSRWIHWQQE